MAISSGGGSSIRIELQNLSTKPIGILTWNTFLEKFPVIKADIKVVRRAEVRERSTDRVVREVQAIDNRVRARYWKVYPEHFLVLAPQQTYSKTLDLQNLFYLGDTCQVLRDKCVYSLELRQQFKMISGDNIDFSAITISDILRLPDVLLGSSRKAYLDLCYATPQRALSKRAMPCDAAQATTLNRARIAAKQLAGFTKRNFDKELWREYFNGVNEVQRIVDSVYRKIEYHNALIFRITELCENTDSDSICRRGMAAYQIRGTPVTIVFCTDFFSNEIQIDKDCESCNSAFPTMIDASGVYLHELTHIDELVQQDISDGEHCVTDAASLRDAPRFDGSPSPFFGHRAYLQDLPENIAAAYELYAYAIRAKGCKEGRWPEPKSFDRLVTYCWTKLKSGCNKCTAVAQGAANAVGSLVVGVATAGLGICSNPSNNID
ncbi:MAG: hypothetical protein M1836_007325 [Candelina mexicana]|nr:MAG: hypothetical protein M1836_007325 [Candelina mexicana]